ncbi:MAG: Dps family protein [Pseudomonadota bacterium]
MSVELLKERAEELPVKTGIDRKDRKMLSELMGRVLASSYVLYHKTHAFHWNITGPMFYSVHKLTEEQYKDLAAANDDLAERIRAIGFTTPTGLTRYINESIVEDVTDMPSAGDMIQQLAQDHQAVATQLRDAVKEAEKVDDVYTADLLTARIGAHEEAAWMLNALSVQ